MLKKNKEDEYNFVSYLKDVGHEEFARTASLGLDMGIIIDHIHYISKDDAANENLLILQEDTLHETDINKKAQMYLMLLMSIVRAFEYLDITYDFPEFRKYDYNGIPFFVEKNSEYTEVCRLIVKNTYDRIKKKSKLLSKIKVPIFFANFKISSLAMQSTESGNILINLGKNPLRLFLNSYKFEAALTHELAHDLDTKTLSGIQQELWESIFSEQQEKDIDISILGLIWEESDGDNFKKAVYKILERIDQTEPEIVDRLYPIIFEGGLFHLKQKMLPKRIKMKKNVVSKYGSLNKQEFIAEAISRYIFREETERKLNSRIKYGILNTIRN